MSSSAPPLFGRRTALRRRHEKKI